MIKIKFFSDYTTSGNLLKRFKSNYNIYDNQLSYTLNDDYNYAIVFNRANEKIKPWAKIITVIQEPSWSEAHEPSFFLTSSDYLIIHDQDLFEEVHQIKLGGKVIESPSLMFYHDHIENSVFRLSTTIQKQKKLSFIVSGKNFDFKNYSKRIHLLDKILDSDLDVDIYGKDLMLADPRFKGKLEYKYTGLIPYEYSIAIENSNEKNYVTEKFFDCVLCHTVPIYYGAPNIKEVYDDRYFKQFDLDSSTIIEDIKKLISEPAVNTAINKDLYFNNYNLYTMIKEVIYND